MSAVVSGLKLFSDYKSHSGRACMLLLRAAELQHDLVYLDLYKGKHWKQKEPPLPFKKLPVLYQHTLPIAESTSILRYAAQLTEGGAPWYTGRDLKSRIKTDEFLDHWQSSINPNCLKLFQNKMLYKMMFRLPEPNAAVVAEALATFNKHQSVVRDYFINQQPFIGGEKASIADILWGATLDQVQLAGVDVSSYGDYLGRLREALGCAVYDEVTKDLKGVPDLLRKMKMIP